MSGEVIKRFSYLSCTVQVGVANTIVVHFELKHTVHVRQLELGREPPLCKARGCQ